MAKPKRPEQPQRRRRRGRRAPMAAALAKGVFVALVLRAFVVEAYVIPSESMTPTLQVGDRIFADKFSYGLSVPLSERKLTAGRSPRRGEVVVFAHPREGTRLVKRVVALAGDRIALQDGVISINGRSIPRRRLDGSCVALAQTAARAYIPPGCVAFEERLGGHRYVVFDSEGSTVGDFGPVEVPPGHVFVLGDNRAMSSDSRVWGAVPRSNLKGRARGILWSYSGADGARWSRWLSGL